MSMFAIYKEPTVKAKADKQKKLDRVNIDRFKLADIFVLRQKARLR